MKDKFKITKSNNGFRITGFQDFSITVNNKFDAQQLCSYLNGQDKLVKDYRNRWVEYYTCLTKIKFIVEDIHQECGELHILEKAIKIKNLLKEVLE